MKGLDYIAIATNIAWDNEIEHVSCNAFRCFIELIAMSGYYLTDGVISLDRALKFCNVRDVRNALQELEKAGFVTLSDQEVSVINYTKWNKSREEVERLRSMNRQRVTHYRERGVMHNTGPVSKSKSKSKKETSIVSFRDGSYSAEFEAFWELYPKRVAKRQAAKCFDAALKRADVGTIMAGLSAQLPIFALRERQYIAHPTTWLNQDRWADEVDQDQKQDELASVLDANKHIRRMR